MYFFLGHQNHVKTPVFQRPYGLCQPKALAIPDVYCRDGEPVWASRRRRGRGGALPRRLAPWRIVQEKVRDTLVGKKDEKVGKEIPEVADVGSTTDIFLYPPFWDLGVANLLGFPFLILPLLLIDVFSLPSLPPLKTLIGFLHSARPP